MVAWLKGCLFLRAFGGSSVVCFMFSPWSVVVLLGVGEYFDNGIVEGKGVWNEPWVSFTTSV